MYRIWRFPEMGYPIAGWFMMENPVKMDDLAAHFQETPIYLRIFEHEWVNI
jgi:hypothetical protein